MTYMGMLLLLIGIAFAAVVIIKVMPLYMEHMKVESALKSLADDANNQPGGMTPVELKKSLDNRFTVNDVEHATKDDIEITKENGKTVISVPYEARIELFYNLDLVAKFPDNRVVVGGP